MAGRIRVKKGIGERIMSKCGGTRAMGRGVLLALFLSLLFSAQPQAVLAEKKISLLLTGNLEGMFSLDVENQEQEDPLLLLGQSIIRERKRRQVDLYLDLGNAFHPGALSKYSYGSVMSDFFHYFDCRATLISSRDIRIGVDNLEFLQKGKRTMLLSANIVRDDRTVYQPAFEYPLDGDTIAFIGISSKKILFDIAEKNIYRINLESEQIALKRTIDTLKEKGVNYIVLLSGLTTEENVQLLRSNKEIDLILCGGDNPGKLHGERMNRIDFSDGRAIVFLQKRKGYYRLDLSLDERVSAGRLRFIPLRFIKTNEGSYREFVNRLSIWKKKFKEEEDTLIGSAPAEYILDDVKISQLLRGRFSAEIALVGINTVNRAHLRGDIRRFQLYRIVNDEYAVFTYTLAGAELKQLSEKAEGFVITGYEEGRVQGYPISDTRRYRVASTQRVFEAVEERLKKKISYTNTWTNITEILVDDLKDEKMLFREDYGYIDRRFRATIDILISNFFDQSAVSRKEEEPVPPGKPEISYRQWGMENKIDLTIYNRYHQFIITPYVYYIEEDIQDGEKNYLQNLLRGTFYYTTNLNCIVRPYHKSQCDSVVRAVDGLRPTIIRETFGANILTGNGFYKIIGNIGAGFEKQIHDPVNDPIYGIEAILKLQMGFLSFLTYGLSIDTFLAKEEVQGREIDHFRSEMENSLSFAINTFLELSLKHKWFYFYKKEYEERYENSQILVSLDIKTDFKIY